MGVRMSARLLVAALLVGVGASSALAAEEPAPAAGGPVTMSVSVGLSGYVDPERPLRVAVELSASSLVVGTLELDFGGRVTTAVEVPAGSVKRYELEGPPPLTRRQLTVRLTSEDGAEMASEAIRLQVPADEMLVGMLDAGALETALRSARSTPLQREVSPIGVTPSDASALAPLSYAIVGPGGLGGFDAAAIGALVQWVEEGGRIYGTAADIGRLDIEGASQALGSTGLLVTRVGAGEVGVLDRPDDLSVDTWSAILRDRPGATRIVDQSRQDSSLALVSAASAGQDASVPALPWLLFGIVLFILLVGPVNFLVLRSMNRPEWAWVTVPLLSVGFLVAFWMVGRSQLPDFSATHALVTIDNGGQTSSRAGVVVQVESAGDHVMALEEGWRAFPSARSIGGGVVSGDVGDAGVEFTLEDLGVGTVELAWDDEEVALDAAVETTTLVSGTNALEVTVTNRSPWTLWAWGAVVNGVGFNGTGSLAPGASGTVTVRSSFSRVAYEPVISEAVARRPFDADNPAGTYNVVYPLATFAESEAPALRDRGAYVFGLTDERDLDVQMDGRTAPAPGTALFVKRFRLPETAAAALGGVRPEVLSVVGASSVERYGDEIYAYGADELYFLYEVPAAAPSRAEINPSFTALDDVAVFDWAAGEFSRFEWGQAFTVDDVASASGEIVIRARVPADSERFFDESITLGRFALRWVDA